MSRKNIITRFVSARAVRLLDAARKACKTRDAEYRLDEITLHTNGYAEHGYADPASGVIATGNWNSISRWDNETRTSAVLDDTPKRLGYALEKIGVELEWSDEWAACECGKLVRTEADSYSWTRGYWQADCGGIYCHECVKNNPTGYLEELEGNEQKALTLAIDLAEHGYVKLDDEFENGLYGGQCDSPKKIADSLRAKGVKRFIFEIDSVGQFETRFGVWVHEDEIGLVPSKLESRGSDPAEGLKRALQNAPLMQGSQPDGSIAVTKIDVSSGTSATKFVSPQDFIDGKALD